MKRRDIEKIKKPSIVFDGAGVELNRVISISDIDLTDPFLMLDHFENSDPNKVMAGFPWHPHRGIETITYMVSGGIYHEDSMGNKGKIKDGDIQWMTAGSGIIHQEMPLKEVGNTYLGFQLWANLPSNSKMMKPRYQEIKAKEIPVVIEEDGSEIKLISGLYKNKTGPIHGISIEPTYLDIFLPPNTNKLIETESYKNLFIYIFDGDGVINNSNETKVVKLKELVIFTEGEYIEITSGLNGIRFLLIAGKPLNEPVAWSGPIVMNTQDEIDIAFSDYRNGTFIK